MKNQNKLSAPVIYIKAIVALMFIQLVHKFVREIPHVLHAPLIFPKVVIIFFTGLLIAGIIGLLCRFRWGLIFGMIVGSWMIFQPFLPLLVFGKMSMSHSDGIWWYPVFPITQGSLIIYFSLLAWRKNKESVNLT